MKGVVMTAIPNKLGRPGRLGQLSRPGRPSDLGHLGRLGVWCALGVVCACSATSPDDDSAATAPRLVAGGLVLEVAADPARLSVLGDDGALGEGSVLIDGLPGGEAGAGVPAVGVAFRESTASWTMQYGAFRIEDAATGGGPPGEGAGPWNAVRRIAGVHNEAGTLTFDLIDSDGAVIAKASATGLQPGGIALDIEAVGPANRASFAFACRPDEHFIGLGGQSWDVDHRGQTVPLWVQEDGLGKAATDAYDATWMFVGRRHSTHTPMPIYLSSAGYALALDTTAFARFSFCDEADNRVRLEAWEGRLRLRFFGGASPLATLEQLTGWTGRPALPPPFAFAPWLDAMYGSENVRRVAAKLRTQDIPASVIWTEDWRGGTVGDDSYTLEEDWHVAEDLYPDFAALATDLHAAGFKFLTYNNTFLSASSDVFDEAIDKGHCIHTADGAPYLFGGVKIEDSSLVDLSSPAAVAWTTDIWSKGFDLGVDGWMADFAEWLPTDAALASGEDARLVHNRYPVDFQKMNKAMFDARTAQDGVERLFFVRSAWLGSQPLVSVVWAGDQQTDFSPGDGFASLIPMGIGLGVTGFPYFGHDIAGYMSVFSEPTTKELWLRWCSLGALSPVMRTHHGKSAFANWNWESDAETTAHLRRWAKLHTRLFPYLYRLAEQASMEGAPMVRALALRWPELAPAWTLTDEYLLGDRILVAPVIEAGAIGRDVWLPGGTWYALEGGVPVDDEPGEPGEPGAPPTVDPAAIEISAAGGTVFADAPATELPAFVPAGTVLVLLPESVDTLTAAQDAGVVALDDVGAARELWLWPGGDSSWTEAAGGASYAWHGDTRIPDGAAGTWNGASVSVSDGVVTVVGAGELLIGASRLTVVAAAGQTTVVRFR